MTLFPKTQFDFAFLAPGASQSIVMARALPIVSWYYLWLGVRVHNLEISSLGATFAVELYQTLPSEEDPKEFTRSTPDMTLSVGSGALAFPTPVTGNNLGPYLKVVLKATMGSGTGRFFGELSAALQGRGA